MRSARAALGYTFGIVLCAALSPLVVYIIVLLLLPVFLLMAVAVPLYPHRTMKDGTPKLSALGQIAVIVLEMLAFAAPFRAVMVLLYGRFPPALERLDGFLGPGTRLFGPGFVPALDFAWAVTGLAAIVLVALVDGSWRLLTARQIESLPRSRVRSVAIGLAELEGIARPAADAPPGAPILRCAWVRKNDSVSLQEEKRSFYLEDNTGRILVDPTGAEFAVDPALLKRGALPKRFFGARMREILLSRRVGRTAENLPEATLMPGDRVYVIGTVGSLEAGPGRASATQEKVVRPRRGVLGGFRFHDVFFVGDTPERRARRYFFSGLRYAIACAIVMGALCTALAYRAHAARRDMGEVYGYSP